MNIETGKKRLKERLDFDELRETLKKIFSDRLKDSKATHKMAMERYGNVSGIDPSYLRQDKRTREAVANALINDMEDDELVNLLWDNGTINPDKTIEGHNLYSNSEDNKYIIRRVIGELDKPKKTYWRTVFWCIWIPCFILNIHWDFYGTYWFASFPLRFIENGSSITAVALMFAIIFFRFCHQVSIGTEYMVKQRKREKIPLFPLWDVQGGDEKPWDISDWDSRRI